MRTLTYPHEDIERAEDVPYARIATAPHREVMWMNCNLKHKLQLANDVQLRVPVFWILRDTVRGITSSYPKQSSYHAVTHTMLRSRVQFSFNLENTRQLPATFVRLHTKLNDGTI
jgi:hypothetical protein